VRSDVIIAGIRKRPHEQRIALERLAVGRRREARKLLMQAGIEEELEQRGAVRHLAVQHGQQIVEIRLAHHVLLAKKRTPLCPAAHAVEPSAAFPHVLPNVRQSYHGMGGNIKEKGGGVIRKHIGRDHSKHNAMPGGRSPWRLSQNRSVSS